MKTNIKKEKQMEQERTLTGKDLVHKIDRLRAENLEIVEAMQFHGKNRKDSANYSKHLEDVLKPARDKKSQELDEVWLLLDKSVVLKDGEFEEPYIIEYPADGTWGIDFGAPNGETGLVINGPKCEEYAVLLLSLIKSHRHVFSGTSK